MIMTSDGGFAFGFVDQAFWHCWSMWPFDAVVDGSRHFLIPEDLRCGTESWKLLSAAWVHVDGAGHPNNP